MEDINNLYILWAILMALPATYRGLALLGSPCRLLRHSKSGCGSFTEWELCIKQGQWYKRNSQPSYFLDITSITSAKLIPLIYSRWYRQ